MVTAALCPQAADALAPALGRWSGGGSGGEIQFAVSRVAGTVVVSDLVVGCSTGAAAAGDDDEEAIERNGRLYSYSFPAGLTGRLGLRSGAVTANASVAGLSGCAHAGLRDVHVAPSGARVVRDGTYALSGPGAHGTAAVYGDGAVLGYNASFSTPVGAVEDNPEGCAEDGAIAGSSAGDWIGLGGGYEPDWVSLAADGSFSAHTVVALGFVAEASLSGRFISATSAVGTYSATFVDGDVADCAGAGPFALTLVRAAPALVPVRAPNSAPPTRTPPRHKKTRPKDRCAMRFQVQQGKTTPYSRPIPSPHPITVQEALAGLGALQSEVTRGMRQASEQAFTATRKWVVARPPHGVSGAGNVKRVSFDYQKKNWRLDTENERCTNLTR